MVDYKTWQQINLMNKSDLKALIKEVVQEVTSIKGLNLPVDVLNIPPEIMDRTVSIVKDIPFEILNLQNLKQALIASAKTAQTEREKAPLDIFNRLGEEKQNSFLKYLKWYIRNKESVYEAKAMNQDWFAEEVELNPEKQEQMTTTQLTGLHHKSEKMLEILKSENVKLEPWMIDLISQAYHNIDAVANKLMFGQKKD